MQVHLSEEIPEEFSAQHEAYLVPCIILCSLLHLVSNQQVVEKPLFSFTVYLKVANDFDHPNPILMQATEAEPSNAP